MNRLGLTFIAIMLLIISNLYSQTPKKTAGEKDPGKSGTTLAIAGEEDSLAIDSDTVQSGAFDYMIGGVFGAVTIDGKNYQQIGLRPELKLWKFTLGLDINVLLDEDGKVREDDWNNTEAYLDKIFFISYGTKGEPFYFRYGGLQSTTLGYGTIINGYTNMLEYPTYKRQGLDFSMQSEYVGMEAVVNNFKELSGRNPALMGGGRIYLRPFSRVQIGASFAGDLNEYKGLRDTDDDGYPDEVDMFPDNDNYVTERDYFEAELLAAGVAPATVATILANLASAGLISDLDRSQLLPYSDERSRTGFWAADAGIRIFEAEYFRFDIYTQFSQCINTGGWGFTAPGMRITGGNLFEIYADYRQQSDDFIFGYYNDTYDLERAKYVNNGSGSLYVETKKDKLKDAIASRGYLAGIKINILNIITGKAEYQDMRWGKDEDIIDKSLKGELSLNKDVIPLISKARAYYVQNNVSDIQLKTESTVIGGVLGLGVAEGVSVDFNYLLTFEDVNGDGEINGDNEEIRNISVSTTSQF